MYMQAWACPYVSSVKSLWLLQEIRGTPHFSNWHSKTGLTAMTLAGLSAVGGAVAFGKIGLLQLFPKDVQPIVKTAHRNVRPFCLLPVCDLSVQKHLIPRTMRIVH